MEMTRAILVAVVLSCFVTGRADAGTYFRDGNALLERCEHFEHAPRDYDKALQGTACRDYVLGVVDALRDAGMFCVPANSVQVNQVVDIATAHLRDHPENRHLPASDLIVSALKEKFPCN